jgi:penicillin-binding protein 1C
VLAADRLWPLPLQEVTPARVVVAEDGTPLWRFADAQGVWRYPVTSKTCRRAISGADPV